MSRVRNRLLLLMLVSVAAVVGFGFYRGWFALSSSNPDAGSEKVDIHLTVDPDKVKADARTVTEKTKRFTGRGDDAARQPEAPAASDSAHPAHANDEK